MEGGDVEVGGGDCGEVGEEGCRGGEEDNEGEDRLV